MGNKERRLRKGMKEGDKEGKDTEKSKALPEFI